MRDIPRDHVLRRLRLENPWWTGTPAMPAPYSEWRPRPYLDLFWPLVLAPEVRRAVVLLGPRRIGKTVLLHHAVQRLITSGVAGIHVGYFAVDHPIYNGLTLEDLLSFYAEATGADYEQQKCFLFFDEIQYLRGWETQLKALVDRHPASRFVVSGSSAAALKLKSAESGAGRFTEFLLPPLTFHEYVALLGRSSLVLPGDGDDETRRLSSRTPNIEELNTAFLHYLNFGGYPEVVLSPAIQRDPGRFIKSDIIDKVLLRDLPSLYGVQDIQELNYLFTTLAFNTANEVSLEGLSRNSGVAKNTIKRYIEYLEAAFLIRVIHRVDHAAHRFKRANYFKVYLTNPSIRSALFSPIESDDEALGHMVETAVFAQWFHASTPLHYARWAGGEVDIVHLTREQKPDWIVEVKWSDHIVDRPDDLRAVLSFCRQNKVKEALITTARTECRRSIGGVALRFVPAALYCHDLGHNIVVGKRMWSEMASRSTVDENQANTE